MTTTTTTVKSAAAKSDWSVKFGAVKSVAVDDVIFTPKPKPNQYIRSKTYLKRPSINLRGMSNSEAY